MAKRLPRPDAPVRVRLELDRSEMPALEDMAAGCRLSVASFTALAVRMLVARGAVSGPSIREEAAKLIASAEPPAAPKRPRGRPRKPENIL